MSRTAQLAPDLPEVTDDPASRRIWVADEDLPAIFRIPRDTMRTALLMLDADPKSGFPKKSPVYKRRWLPAIDSYYDEVYGPKIKLSRSFDHDR